MGSESRAEATYANFWKLSLPQPAEPRGDGNRSSYSFHCGKRLRTQISFSQRLIQVIAPCSALCLGKRLLLVTG